MHQTWKRSDGIDVGNDQFEDKKDERDEEEWNFRFDCEDAGFINRGV